MTRVGPFGVGDKLTTAQINAIDLNATYGLDARSGQTASMQAVATCSGAGRLIKSYVAGANTNNTYTLSSGCSFIDGGAATISGADVTYTLSATGASLNDTIEIRGNAAKPIVVKDGASGTVLVTLIPQVNEKALAELFFSGTNWVLRRVTGNESRVRVLHNRPGYWSGTTAFGNNATGFATDKSQSDANMRPVLKDYTGSNPGSLTDIFSAAHVLQNLTSANQGQAWGWTLDANHLIEGRVLSNVTATISHATTTPNPGPDWWFRFFIYAMPWNDGPVYLSNAAYPGGVSTTIGAANATHTATMTCNQNNVVDLNGNIYFLVLILGPTWDGHTSLRGFTFTHD